MKPKEVDPGRANGGRELSQKAESVLQEWQNAMQQNSGSGTVLVCNQSISRSDAEDIIEWLQYLADNNALKGNDDARMIPMAVLTVSTKHQELQKMVFQKVY